MSRPGRLVVFRAAAVAAVALGVSACDITVGAVEYKVSEEKRFAVTGPARVNLSTFDGSIEVRGWDRPEVLIEIEKRGPDQQTTDAIKVTATQQGATVTIDIPEPSGFRSTNWRNSPSARIVASIPATSNVVIRSGDGSVTLRRVTGSLDIKTEDGSVRLDGTSGALLVRTGDGSIHAEDVNGTVDAQTGDGSVALEGILKAVRVETNDGSVQVTARQGSAMDTDWSMVTGDGSIRAELAKGFSAEIDAESGDGRVYVEGLTKDHDDESASGGRHDREERRRRASGTLGSGGKLLKLRTGDGSITVQVW